MKLTVARYRETLVLDVPTYEDGQAIWYDAVSDVFYGGKLRTPTATSTHAGNLWLYRDADGVVEHFCVVDFSAWLYHHDVTELLREHLCPELDVPVRGCTMSRAR